LAQFIGAAGAERSCRVTDLVDRAMRHFDAEVVHVDAGLAADDWNQAGVQPDDHAPGRSFGARGIHHPGHVAGDRGEFRLGYIDPAPRLDIRRLVQFAMIVLLKIAFAVDRPANDKLQFEKTGKRFQHQIQTLMYQSTTPHP